MLRFFTLLALLLSGLAAQAFSGIVIKVTDGDTVWVQPDDTAQPAVKLRLMGIDAPESCQAWGPQATQALADKVLNQAVEVQGNTHDSYQRLLGQLVHQNENMSAWMVSQGHAWSYRYRNSTGPYQAQELEARQHQRGLFSEPSFEEPRWFRQTHGPCHALRHTQPLKND
jgi:micrococcal nuclease